MKRLQFIKRFLKFYFSAQTKYHIHSPFVYDFCEKILDDDRIYYAFSGIEIFRELLKTNQNQLQITEDKEDIVSNKLISISISNLAKRSSPHWVFCRILFKIIEQYQLKNILEIGTCLGIPTLYQAAAATSGKVFTLENSKVIANQAKKNFERMQVKNVEVLTGEYEYSLEESLLKLNKLDYVFFAQGNSTEVALAHFNQCLKKARDQSIFVINNPYKSIESEANWEEIKNHPKVTLTIDLFFLGLVFFRKDRRVKEHFKLIKSNWKPFGVGIRDLLRG